MLKRCLVVLFVFCASTAYAANVCNSGAYGSSYSYSVAKENAVRCYVQRQSGTWNCSGSQCVKSDDASRFYNGVVESGVVKVRNQVGGISMVVSGSATNLTTTDADGSPGTCKVEYFTFCGVSSCSPPTPVSLKSCGVQR